MHRPTTASDLAARLRSATVEALEAIEHTHVPGWRIPGTFGGHAVGADVRADVCFTLTQLAGAGVTTIAGEPIDAVLVRLLAEVDGGATNTFFSYRIAETLLRVGPFEANPLLASFDERQRAEVEAAVDSSDWIELLDTAILPRNYAAVLARCELARHRLGLVDGAVVDELVARAVAVLGDQPSRALDDSNDRLGRYDIYSADVWLFCEPLADRIGPLWTEGFAAALDLVRAVGARDGTAVAWGRSTGDLAAALTIELAALALAGGHAGTDQGLWLRRAADAADTVLAGFDDDGVANAHRHRSQDSYRGPARRLQLTYDLLGKLAWAAGTFQRVEPELRAAPAAEAYPPHDELVRFESERHAAVWAHRSPGADLVVPFVGIIRSHYLPALHHPATWEVPVDRDLPCWTPLVIAGSKRYTAGGLPAELEHEPGRVTARWDGLPTSGRGLDGDEASTTLAGTRTVSMSVEGRTIVVDDRLTFERVPDAVTVTVPVVAGRPLHVEWTCSSGHAVTDVTVDGLAEWRSPWSELVTAHQLDLDPAQQLVYQLRVTPLLRVASTEPEHHYSQSLYGPMADRVVVHRTPVGWNPEPDPGLRRLDLLHLHWPEWVAFDDLDAHRAIIEELADHDVPVVWTAHNLTPHEKRPEAFDRIYGAWAAAAAGVIHHSAWGEARMRERYEFAPDARHELIPHGHFGGLWEDAGLPDRATAEQVLGLASRKVRIGIVGAPRSEKLVQVVLDAVAASSRDDVELVCWSLARDDVVPEDPRIAIAKRYRFADRATYATRLAACDALALVFDPDGDMLATGAAADAVGVGLPVLRSDWGYLVEVLGAAGIPAGHTVETVAAAIDALTPEVLAAARTAAAERRAALAWGPLADRTADLFERVVQRLP